MIRLPYWSGALLLVLACSSFAQGQAPTAEPLPDAPSAFLQATPPAAGDAQVRGFVTDNQGSAVPNAQVTLSAPGIVGDRTTTAGGDGTFSFTVPPGPYRLSVTANSFESFTSDEFTVQAGQTFDAINPALKVSASATVNVVASPDQIAVAQVHQEEKQRVLGIVPNFYTSYIWNAQPLPTREKYQLATRSLLDPVQFGVDAATAGAEQINGTYPGYGPGPEGYGKRYGAAVATSVSSRMLGSAVFPGLFHQDPRYFYQGSGGTASRAEHALSFVFLCRGDNGKDQFCYSHLMGSLAAAGIANAYLPASSRGVGVTFQTFGITLAGNVASDLFREFVLRHFENIPRFANGKH